MESVPDAEGSPKLVVIHTADWHLGQSFLGFNRDVEHSGFLEWLVSEIKERQPSLLLIAGDVFDTINPSATAQRLYYNFLANAHAVCKHLQTVIIAGNHDAGARLEAPQDLLDAMRISVVGTVVRDEEGEIDLRRFLIPVRDLNGNLQAIVVAVPFLRPSDVPLVTGAKDPYLDGIHELYRKASEQACKYREEHDAIVPIIAMGHLHLDGGFESKDSERRLIIGGAEAVNIDMLSDELAYVALGHLHKAQEFRAGLIRYSGSPLPLSFTEMPYSHQIVQIKFDGPNVLDFECILVPRSVEMLSIPATGYAPIGDVLTAISALELEDQPVAEKQPYLEVRVLDDHPDPARRRNIEKALEGKPVRLASIKVEYPSRAKCDDDEGGDSPTQDLRSIQPEDVFLNAYQQQYGNPPSNALIACFREILLQEVQKQ
jgi:exonuclease SbcD